MGWIYGVAFDRSLLASFLSIRRNRNHPVSKVENNDQDVIYVLTKEQTDINTMCRNTQDQVFGCSHPPGKKTNVMREREYMCMYACEAGEEQGARLIIMRLKKQAH